MNIHIFFAIQGFKNEVSSASVTFKVIVDKILSGLPKFVRQMHDILITALYDEVYFTTVQDVYLRLRQHTTTSLLVYFSFTSEDGSLNPSPCA